jgi:hypothetical protein
MKVLAQWGSRIDNMGLDLMRETKRRIEKISPNSSEGAILLVSEFMKGTFVLWLNMTESSTLSKLGGKNL